MRMRGGAAGDKERSDHSPNTQVAHLYNTLSTKLQQYTSAHDSSNYNNDVTMVT